MYRLYANIAGWKILDVAAFEDDIVTTILEDNKKYKHFDFMIIKTENNTDDIYMRTRTQEDLKEYLEEYKARKQIREASCTELKKYIVTKGRKLT